MAWRQRCALGTAIVVVAWAVVGCGYNTIQTYDEQVNAATWSPTWSRR